MAIGRQPQRGLGTWPEVSLSALIATQSTLFAAQTFLLKMNQFLFFQSQGCLLKFTGVSVCRQSPKLLKVFRHCGKWNSSDWNLNQWCSSISNLSELARRNQPAQTYIDLTSGFSRSLSTGRWIFVCLLQTANLHLHSISLLDCLPFGRIFGMLYQDIHSTMCFVTSNKF